MSCAHLSQLAEKVGVDLDAGEQLPVSLTLLVSDTAVVPLALFKSSAVCHHRRRVNNLHFIDLQAGGLAGCCFWMGVFPLDVIKNRILSVRGPHEMQCTRNLVHPCTAQHTPKHEDNGRHLPI